MPWFRTPRLALALISVSALGCENNTITLETSPDPSDDGDPTVGTMTGGGTVTTTDGLDTGDTDAPVGPQLLLFALSTPLEPSLPFQGLVNLTPGNGTTDLTLQWLSLSPGSTTAPREPVGDQYAYPGLAVDASGTFFWDTGVILIPGAANPLTGEDLVVSVQANVVSLGGGTPAYCGEAGGTLIAPLEASLDVSTHAMTAVVDTLPATFAMSC